MALRSWLAVECYGKHRVRNKKDKEELEIRLNAGLSFLLHRGDRINFLVLAIRNPVTRHTHT